MKRNATIAVVLFLVFSMLFTACQLNGDGVSKPSDSTTQAPIESTAKPDYFTAPGQLPIVTKPTTIELGIKPSTLITNHEDNYLTKYIEERTGIDLEFYFFPTDEAEQKLELMVSSNQELPDILAGISLSEKAKLTYGQQGVILELSDYFENLAYFWNVSVNEWCTEYEAQKMNIYSRSSDGGQYVFPTLYESPSESLCHGYYINTLWLDNLGLKVPTTLDELKIVLEAFRDNDPNGNSKKDEIPAMGYTGGWINTGNLVQMLINSFIYYSDYKMNVDNGVVYAPFTTDTFKSALTYIKTWVDEGLITDLTFTQDEQQAKTILDAKELDKMVVGLMDMYPSFVFSGYTEARSYYQPLQCLPGPDGVYHTPRKLTSSEYNVAITKYCEYPEVAFRLLDFLCEAECSLTSRYGEKNVNWFYLADTKEQREPKYGSMGYEALWYYTKNPYSSENNEVWCQSGLMQLPGKLFNSQGFKNREDPIQRRGENHWLNGIGIRFNKNNAPDETIEKVIYTLDEINQIAEIETTIFTYVDESVTRFMMGELSIDNDWNKYLADLKSMGLELYTNILQTAYTRMMSK